MQFCFYPTLERACGNVSHCPHLGGASIGTLVQIANHSGTTIDQLYRQLDAVRKRNSELVDDNLRLAKELQQVKLEMKLERQNKFATNEQKNADLHLAQQLGLLGNPSPNHGSSDCDLPTWVGPRYLLPGHDGQWAIHEMVSALEAMDCPIEPIDW